MLYLVTIGLTFCLSKHNIRVKNKIRAIRVANILQDLEDSGFAVLALVRKESEVDDAHFSGQKEEREYLASLKRKRGGKVHKPDGKIRMLRIGV